MQDFSLLLVFMTGLASGWHCIGMCSGLVSAFTLNLPYKINKFKLIVLLNLGRIFSYVLIGFVFGGLSQATIILENTQIIKNILFIISNIILFFLGLYFLGISILITKIEKIGVPIWKKLNPLLSKLIPIDSALKSFCFGIIWGWLPCGLVYSVSIYALLSSSAYKGALIMLCFGLGTLPNLISLGYFTSILSNFIQRKIIRLIIGFFLFIFSIWKIGGLFV